MKLRLSAAMLAIALAASACGSSHQAAATASSSRLILGGAVKCTATVPRSVQIGQDLGASFSFENVSNHTVEVQPAYGGPWVVVTSPDGTTYDTRIPLENSSGPPPTPISLRPGATVTRSLRPSLRVRWEGQLSIIAGCTQAATPPIHVAVTSPGAPTSEKAAIRDVVTATGHLLDHCRPTASGVSVVGRIDAPHHSAPPLQTRCSITLHHRHDFDFAEVLVAAPPGLRGIRVSEPYGAIMGYRGNMHTNSEVIAWEFVVSRNGAVSVDSTTVESAKYGSGLSAPEWQWTSTGVRGRAGGALCGHTGGGGGGYLGPLVEFPSICR